MTTYQFWNSGVTCLSYRYLPIYSELEINRNRELTESKYIGF